MTAIIRHLIDFGREGGRGRALVDLAELATRTARLLAPTASKRSCRLVVENSAGPVRVHVNSSEMDQVLTNLILNAVQAMPSGGVVRIVTRREAELGCVVVTDEGVGIAEADLSRVFDPFFTTRGVGEGTGLGLSVSYGIVNDHGGHIDVRSDREQGTSFAVRLPLHV
jgi:signal transduction histidine kinase